jgi:hypothetical protein
MKGKLRISFLTLCAFLVGQVALAHNNVVVIPMEGDSQRVYEIGETGPAGGIVYHVTDGGRHGLEASHEDQSVSAEWGCLDTDVNFVENLRYIESLDPNSGARNTLIITLACGGATAAGVAGNYMGPNGITTNWYLPNKEELYLLYYQQGVVGDFDRDLYWSSSESSSGVAWFQGFNGGLQERANKFATLGVRAVRAF